MKRTYLPPVLRPFAGRIAEVVDERATEEGYWVYLIDGWWSPEDETHCIHEDTPAECAVKMMRIQPCSCCNKESTCDP